MMGYLVNWIVHLDLIHLNCPRFNHVVCSASLAIILGSIIITKYDSVLVLITIIYMWVMCVWCYDLFIVLLKAFVVLSFVLWFSLDSLFKSSSLFGICIMNMYMYMYMYGKFSSENRPQSKLCRNLLIDLPINDSLPSHWPRNIK